MDVDAQVTNEPVACRTTMGRQPGIGRAPRLTEISRDTIPLPHLSTSRLKASHDDRIMALLLTNRPLMTGERQGQGGVERSREGWFFSDYPHLTTVGSCSLKRGRCGGGNELGTDPKE